MWRTWCQVKKTWNFVSVFSLSLQTSDFVIFFKFFKNISSYFFIQQGGNTETCTQQNNWKQSINESVFALFVLLNNGCIHTTTRGVHVIGNNCPPPSIYGWADFVSMQVFYPLCVIYSLFDLMLCFVRKYNRLRFVVVFPLPREIISTLMLNSNTWKSRFTFLNLKPLKNTFVWVFVGDIFDYCYWILSKLFGMRNWIQGHTQITNDFFTLRNINLKYAHCPHLRRTEVI